MIGEIKVPLKLLEALLIASSSTGIFSYKGGMEKKYNDLEIVSSTDVVREIDGVESDITLVTVKNKGNKFVDPESVVSNYPDVVATYSWEDNTGVNCLIDTNETFVFSITNCDNKDKILDYVTINAIEKDVRVLWTREISAFSSDFCRDESGNYDYTGKDFIFYADEKNPYLKHNQKVIAKKGLAYYALDGVSYTSFINGDELNIRSHDSLLNVDVAILHIDYFYVSVEKYQSSTGNEPIIGHLTYDLDFSVIFKTPLIIVGASVLGCALVVTLAIVSKKLVDKKHQGK